MIACTTALEGEENGCVFIWDIAFGKGSSHSSCTPFSYWSPREGKGKYYSSLTVPVWFKLRACESTGLRQSFIAAPCERDAPFATIHNHLSSIHAMTMGSELTHDKYCTIWWPARDSRKVISKTVQYVSGWMRVVVAQEILLIVG